MVLSTSRCCLVRNAILLGQIISDGLLLVLRLLNLTLGFSAPVSLFFISILTCSFCWPSYRHPFCSLLFCKPTIPVTPLLNLPSQCRFIWCAANVTLSRLILNSRQAIANDDAANEFGLDTPAPDELGTRQRFGSGQSLDSIFKNNADYEMNIR